MKYILQTCKGTTHPVYEDVIIFYKVPFALPPVDTLRFAAPVLASDWSKVNHSKVYKPIDTFLSSSYKIRLDATKPGRNCIQAFEFRFFDPTGNPEEGSEDCLYLNIYVKKTALGEPHKALPVYLYFHGGAFLLGDSLSIDGAKIASGTASTPYES